MEVIYALEDFPDIVVKSIFLAGPTPRTSSVDSWREDALKILRTQGFDGTIFVPEPRDGIFSQSYTDQIQWEDEALNRADCILFWVPRDMVTLPGLTTNHEHGEWFKSGKVVLGVPFPLPPHCRYLLYKADKESVQTATTLEETVENALNLVGEGSLRTDGECHVPLYVWQTDSFQAWYQAQKRAGNRLDGARVEWTFRVGPDRKFVFFWILHVDVYIANENRNKTNEVVLSRPDIATVVMYKPAPELRDSIVILIREFRSPASTEDCFVREVPGGSSFKPTDNPLQLAADEVYEETGLRINDTRMIACGSRQLVATLSAHKAHLFSVEIRQDELDWLQTQTNVAHGVIEDTERTYVEIRTLGEIIDGNFVDWNMLGMILSVLVR